MNGPANVQVIDWCSERVQKRSFGAADFVQWFLHQGGSQRPTWSKCRWINVRRGPMYKRDHHTEPNDLFRWTASNGRSFARLPFISNCSVS